MRGVVHIVVDSVKAWKPWARVLRRVCWAARRGLALHGGIVDQISLPGAVEALEHVEKPEPVTDLVCRRLAFVVRLALTGPGAARQGVRVHMAPVENVVRSPVDAVVEGVLVGKFAPPR